MKSSYLIKLSGTCGIVLPIVTLLNLFLAIQGEPWFSWTENAISDLGRSEVASSTFFNYSIILVGVLLLIFSVGLAKILMDDKPEGKIGPVLFSLSSIFLIGIGLIPSPDLSHDYVSGLFFVVLLPLAFS